LGIVGKGLQIMNWNEYFRGIVHQIKLKSKDKYTQIGALIVGSENEIVSTGYNSFPRGLNDEVEERQERPEKYYWFSHAETNSIINAARNGVSTKGTTMYMSCGIPCTDCARNIINAGIVEIVCERVGGASGNIWDEHAKRSLVMFEEAGVKVTYFE
jgi:dCMP deaminase